MSETNYSGISVCIITRDQRDKLEKCLAAVKDELPGAEIVVLDTGSHDDSAVLAARFTDNVSEFTWCDDFSAAKNACIDRAANDHVLVLDTDEYVNGIDTGNIKLTEGLRKYPEAVGRVRRSNSYINEQGYSVTYDEWINRFFDRRLYKYEGRIHEQVVLRDPGDRGKNDYRMYRLDLSLFHDGYDLSPEEMKLKAGRNAILLKKELADCPDDPYLYYQLGKTFYTAGDKAEASDNLLKALELKPPYNMEYMSDLIMLAGYVLLDTGRADKGIEILESYKGDRRYSEDADFMFLYAMLEMNNTRFLEARESFIRCTDLKPSATEGTASYLAWYNAGVISEVMGEIDKAREYYKKAGKFEGAIKGLDRIKNSI